MKIDNLFIVESPLQALVALELSLIFSKQRNGVIASLSGGKRVRNDQQIRNVLCGGCWDFYEEINFKKKSGLSYHLDLIKILRKYKRIFEGAISTLYIGEFRSEWMHYMRASINADFNYLLDDGAATLTVKRNFLDKGCYYPSELWVIKSKVKKIILDVMYQGFKFNPVHKEPINIASAFLDDPDVYRVDFSSIKEKYLSADISEDVLPKAYYFGSKYSEDGIITLNYELVFLTKVKAFYESRGLQAVYCAHRDESQEKLTTLKEEVGFNVIEPDVPAELFLLERHRQVASISAAYSSVLNNCFHIFPEKEIISFRLTSEEIAEKRRGDIDYVYCYFSKKGIIVRE